MKPIRTTVADDLIEMPRDARWHAEVAREKLVSVVLTERHARWSNLLLWALMVVATINLPNPRYVFAALAFRLFAMLLTHPTLSFLRRCIETGRGIRRASNATTIALAIGGASWALLMASAYVDPVTHFARAIIAGGSFIALALIYSLLAPMPKFAFAFMMGFATTFLSVIGTLTEISPLNSILAVGGLVAVIVSYGSALANREIRAAEMIVENRLLGEELADSLAHAEFLAFRDPLTGLLNRRAFFEELDGQEVDRTRHIVTIDLDHFKSINDRFGHPVGDRVLVATGSILRDIARELPGEGNCAVRMGGEEFLVLVDTDDAQFISLACEKIRQRIRTVANELDIEGVETSASIGIAAWAPGTNVDEVISYADDALYRAKERGRNQVVCAAA